MKKLIISLMLLSVMAFSVSAMGFSYRSVDKYPNAVNIYSNGKTGDGQFIYRWSEDITLRGKCQQSFVYDYATYYNCDVRYQYEKKMYTFETSAVVDTLNDKFYIFGTETDLIQIR